MATTIIQRKVNPYLKLATLVKDTIDYVGTNLSGTPTAVDIVTLTGDYVNTLQYNTTNRFELNEIDTYGLAATALNSYNNNIDTEFYESDSVESLLSIQSGLTSDELNGFLEGIESRGFSTQGGFIDEDDLRVILMGTSIGIELTDYWATQISLGASSPWDSYISAFTTSWVSEGVRGAIMFESNGEYSGILTAAAVFSIYNVLEPSL